MMIGLGFGETGLLVTRQNQNEMAKRAFRRSSRGKYQGSKKQIAFNIRRAYERSTAFGIHCRQGALMAREAMASLHANIMLETNQAREAIRSRQDADEYENELRSFERQKLQSPDAALETELEEMANEAAAQKRALKENRPALPVGEQMPDDVVADVEKAAKILGISVDKVAEI